MDDAYLIAAHHRDGLYSATEIAPGGVEATTIWAESPSDLAAQIAASWAPIDVYVGSNAELADNLIPFMPAEYAVFDGRPAPIQTSYL